MESYLCYGHYDLMTPDGVIKTLAKTEQGSYLATVKIEAISPSFVGFELDKSLVSFNVKSTLAQLGIHGHTVDFELDAQHLCARVSVQLLAYGKVADALLDLLEPGSYIGKLFAADDRRKVRDPEYLSRMLRRSDSQGSPLLSLGGMQGSGDLILDRVDGRMVAFLTLQNGRVEYDDSALGFLPTVAAALNQQYSIRNLLSLQQRWIEGASRNVEAGEILLVKTLPLHIQTVFGRVADDLLAEGYSHTSANILQPNTFGSGDIYEFFGQSPREITDVPLEFFTLEPHREHVYFEDQTAFQQALQQPETLFTAFDSAPMSEDHKTATFVVSKQQLLTLADKDWVNRQTHKAEFAEHEHPARQARMVDGYIQQQASYPFLKAIEDGLISSQGVLLSRYLPTPLMKRFLLSASVQRCLKAVYFEKPSLDYGNFFTQEDRALLNDMVKFGIPCFWVERATNKILQYLKKSNKDSGMFVPLAKVQTYLQATMFGVYGSNLLEGDFEGELVTLMQGIINMQSELSHPLLNPESELALITGGGPGAMAVGNRVAKDIGILSCANIVDFGNTSDGQFVNEQLQNPYVEAKMTYQLNKLVERQAEFHLDFPIFLMGGVGTDFEFALEEVNRKIGSTLVTPVLLFGSADYWAQKITHRFHCNLASGTISGSEWLSNCFYCVESAEQALSVYRQFFEGKLAIGPKGPVFEQGFVNVNNIEPKLKAMVQGG